MKTMVNTTKPKTRTQKKKKYQTDPPAEKWFNIVAFKTAMNAHGGTLCNTTILTWRIQTVMVLWAPTGEVVYRSSLSVHASSQLGSINSRPVPLGNHPHAQPGTVVQDTRFL